MREITGDLFKIESDAICVTTNGVVKGNGELVMGKGVAKEFARRWPQLPAHFGQLVRAHGNIPHLAYNPIRAYVEAAHKGVEPDMPLIISFPTKHHWSENSDLQLIRNSAFILKRLACNMGLQSVAMTRPGCGLGGLTWDVVKPVLLAEWGDDDRFIIVTPKGENK